MLRLKHGNLNVFIFYHAENKIFFMKKNLFKKHENRIKKLEEMVERLENEIEEVKRNNRKDKKIYHKIEWFTSKEKIDA